MSSQASGTSSEIGSNSDDSKVGPLAVDERTKKGGRRFSRQHSKEPIDGMLRSHRRYKNSRKPRSRFGRGLAKKGGAGGKGVWGKLGSESEGVEVVDRNDPNYDSESLDNDDVELTCVTKELSDEDLQKKVELIVLEYYESGELEEALVSLEELECSSKKYMIPLLSIEIALDHKLSRREMTSVLLAEMAHRIVKLKDMFYAFKVLLNNLPDLILDTPDAADVLGNFLARAAADACLPNSAIESLKESVTNDHARNAISRAETLLSSEPRVYKLDNVWGIGGGLRPVKTLIRQMNMLLEEYISSGDIQEATRCLVSLEVPHFHHELVYEAIVLTLEALNENIDDSICALLKSLANSVILTPEMIEVGFSRVFEDMPDIILDVPLAYMILDRFVKKCRKAGFIGEDIVRKVPTRGRKRFVSEGDGGRVKEH